MISRKFNPTAYKILIAILNDFQAQNHLIGPKRVGPNVACSLTSLIAKFCTFISKKPLFDLKNSTILSQNSTKIMIKHLPEKKRAKFPSSLSYPVAAPT